MSSESDDLRDLGTHFRFGENWTSYARIVDAERVRQAEIGLEDLLGTGALQGKTFMDVGCGSGIHALAAHRLGASRVLATDIDPESVAAAKSLLSSPFSTGHGEIAVRQMSVFDMQVEETGKFDFVYSWGVLHHTGHLAGALARAVTFVGQNDVFAFALYDSIVLDPLWRLEKRWYSRASGRSQARARKLYERLMAVLLKARGQTMQSYRESYDARGMDLEHDLHDWMGGYPYESMSAEAVHRVMDDLGFERVLVRTSPRGLGLLGSGNNEYVYSRRAGSSAPVAGGSLSR